MRIGKREFEIGTHTYVMGILNVTPDSFSDGGIHQAKEAALRHADQMIGDGADVIDVGGESTRPNYSRIDAWEETDRVLPIIKEIKKRWDVPISIDTYKAKVAEAALDAGADMVNDVWGLKYDGNMASVIQRYDAAVCLMHNRSNTNYGDLLKDVRKDLEESVQMAMEAGIGRDKMIIDPGIGFAKDYEQNLTLIANLDRFHSLGLPILLGASRKSVIGMTLDLPVTQREEGTLTTTVVATLAGCDFIRVHDVKGNARAIRMALALRKRRVVREE